MRVIRDNISMINIDKLNKKEWKTKNKKYLLELEKFLDVVESVKDEELKKQIIVQMLKCDDALTKAAEELF